MNYLHLRRFEVSANVDGLNTYSKLWRLSKLHYIIIELSRDLRVLELLQLASLGLGGRGGFWRRRMRNLATAMRCASSCKTLPWFAPPFTSASAGTSGQDRRGPLKAEIDAYDGVLGDLGPVRASLGGPRARGSPISGTWDAISDEPTDYGRCSGKTRTARTRAPRERTYLTWPAMATEPCSSGTTWCGGAAHIL